MTASKLLYRARIARSWLPYLLILLVAVVAGEGASYAAEEYRLGPNDRVQVTVFDEPSLSGDFEVDGEGRVTLPLIGEVTLAGLTVREAEQAVVAKLYPDYLLNPKVGIQVTNYRPFYILGEVKKPGSYPYTSGITIIQAVAVAGGFTYRARQSEVLLVRAGERARVSSDTSILPGDIVEIAERFF